MIRNLIVLGCAGLLAIGLSMSSSAGLDPDTDLDGIADSADNCTLAPNGPDLGTGSCNNQEDGDVDGYGNPCDADLDNDGAAGLSDLVIINAQQKAVSTDPRWDVDCDGAAGLSDLVIVNAAQKAIEIPGPSGLACAGTVPCP
jgi:hypothetical protein